MLEIEEEEVGGTGGRNGKSKEEEQAECGVGYVNHSGKIGFAGGESNEIWENPFPSLAEK